MSKPFVFESRLRDAGLSNVGKGKSAGVSCSPVRPGGVALVTKIGSEYQDSSSSWVVSGFDGSDDGSFSMKIL